MPQAVLEMPVNANAEQITLLQAIKAGQDENDVEISLVLNHLNKGVAQLVEKNGKIITGLQGKILKRMQQELVDNDNIIDQFSTALLGWSQNELADTHLLLTQLAAQADLTAPGDPLEAALIERLAAAPDMAYSATLLMAIRDAMPHFAALIEVLREIRDRMPGSPVRFKGEAKSQDEDTEYVDLGGDEEEDAIDIDWPIV